MKLVTTADASILENYSVAVHFMRLLTDYTERHGLPLDRLLELANIHHDILNDPNDRVRFSDFAHACDIAANVLSDPDLGLNIGQTIRPGHLGTHGFAMMSCATAEEMLLQSARYSALTMDVGHNEFKMNGAECVRYWRSNLPEGVTLGRLQEDLNQATSVTLVRWFGNREDLNPSWVSFRHSKPSNIRAYETLFRCPLRFEASETAIGFPSDYLKLRLPHADTQVNRIMRDLCTQLIKKLGNALEPAWLAIARKTVLESFKHGMPEIAAVAKATEMTEAELKELLSERGITFRSFVDELRQAMALGYIRDPKMGLVVIAYLLGFSEQSAFQRAFKRWTGMTPGEYRQIKSND